MSSLPIPTGFFRVHLTSGSSVDFSVLAHDRFLRWLAQPGDGPSFTLNDDVQSITVHRAHVTLVQGPPMPKERRGIDLTQATTAPDEPCAP